MSEEANNHLPPSHWQRLVGWLRPLILPFRQIPLSGSQAMIAFTGLAICIYAISVMAYALATPEIGLRCAFTPVVNYHYSEFIYPKGQGFFESGDRIIRVGGEDIDTWSQLVRKTLLLREKQAQHLPGLSAADVHAGKIPKGVHFVELDGVRIVQVEYTRQKDGKTVEGKLWCRLGRSPLITFLPSILWFSLNFGLFVVGVLGYWKRSDDRPAARFFWLCVVSLGAFVGGYHWFQIVTQPVLLFLFMACAMFLPAVSLHFNMVFPRSRPFFDAYKPWWLLLIYCPAAVFLIVLFKDYLLIRRLDGGGGAGILSGLEKTLGVATGDPSGTVQFTLVAILFEIYLYFAVAVVWFFAGIVCLIHSYRTAANAIERNQVKWILFGSAAATIPLGYTLYLAFWDQGNFGGGGGTWPMFLASSCITVAYTISITRYRLLQLDQFISSGAVYALISTLAGLVYYGVVLAGILLVGSQTFEGPSLSNVLLVCGTAMALMVALDVARGRILRAVDRHLRREKYQLDRTLQSLGQTIERLVDTPTLARQLLHTTTGLLSAPAGAVFLRQDEPPLYRLADHLGPVPSLAELSPGCPLVESLRTQLTLRIDSSIPTPATRQLTFLRGGIAQALMHEGNLLGFLILALRPDGPYTAEDVQVLAAFARLSVLALVSAEGHRTIDALNRELKTKVEKIAEQQRRIMALQSQLTRRESTTPAVPESPTSPEPPIDNTRLQTAGIVGGSPAVREVLQLVRQVAVSSSAVLLRGESGTGKELLARALHECSPRATKPFIKVHCAALSPGLLESELFGHVKGAFTSAIRDKIGRFEAADGGTLFLDEIGDISLEVQTKLLRVLEEMTFERVGSSESVQVDVRIVAATHRDLEAMMADGRFREDLFFRLNVLPVFVPPLRQRIEDVPELALHFVELYASRLAKIVRSIDDDALVALKAYHWPGNVRQLENVIERAVIFTEGPVISVDALPPEVRDPAPDNNPSNLSLPELAEAILTERGHRQRREREQLVRALAAAGGNKAVAARALGLARSTLLSRLRKYGLS